MFKSLRCRIKQLTVDSLPTPVYKAEYFKNLHPEAPFNND